MRDYFPISEIQTTNKTSFSGHEEKEVVVAIPNGKKSYLWFCTNQQGEDACYLVPRNFKTQPEWADTSLTNLSETPSPQPFYGTLISGTLVYLNHPSKNTAKTPEYFVADDMFYFQGISLSKSIFQERLQYLVSFFRKFIPTSPLNYTKTEKKSGKKNIILVLANMRGIKESPLQTPIYKIHHWQLRNLSIVSPYYSLSSLTSLTSLTSVPSINPTTPSPPEPTRENVRNNTNKMEWIFQYQNPAYKQKAIFKIVPEEQCDIYTLYARLSTNNSKQSQTTAVEWVSCGYAGIFDYDTSKLLNLHCRKIVSDIDQMEESDDEEESTPPNSPCVQTFFECAFSTKFRKWVPVSFLPHGSPENVIVMDSIASLKSKHPHKYQPHTPFTRKYT